MVKLILDATEWSSKNKRKKNSVTRTSPLTTRLKKNRDMAYVTLLFWHFALKLSLLLLDCEEEILSHAKRRC